MSVDVFWAHQYTQEPTETSEVQCPECEEWSPAVEWTEAEVGCEDCGSHDGVKCPRCDERHDHIHGPTFQVREMTQVVTSG